MRQKAVDTCRRIEKGKVSEDEYFPAVFCNEIACCTLQGNEEADKTNKR